MVGVAITSIWMKFRLTNPHVICLGVLTLVILLNFFPLFQGKFYAIGDMRDVFIPLELFFQQELKAGHLPIWNPDIAWGYPVLAAAQIGFFYPPLLIARLLPLSIYLPLTLLVHFIALGWGMYFFVQKILDRPSSAFIAGLSFTLSAFVLQHLTHLNITLAIAWLPWQLFWAHTLSQHKKISSLNLVFFIFTLGIPFLIGQFQIPFLIALLSILYYIVERYRIGVSLSSLVFSLGVIGLAVAGLIAIQALPTFELVQYSSRGSSGDFEVSRANQHSFPIYHLPTIIFPRFFGNDTTYWGKRLEIEYGIFIGTLPLLLALSTFRSAFWKKPDSRFWLIVTGLSFLLALGTYSPFRLLGLEPSLWVFSAPARWLLITTGGLSILAGYGWDAWCRGTYNLKNLLRLAFIVLSACVVIYNVLFYVIPDFLFRLFSFIQPYLSNTILTKEPVYYQQKLEMLTRSLHTSGLSLWSLFSILPLLIILIALITLKHRVSKFILLSLISLEIILVGMSTIPTASWKTILSIPSTYFSLPETIRAKQARIISVREGGDTGAFFTDPQSKLTHATREKLKNLLLPLLNSQFGVAGVEWPASLDLQSATTVLSALRPEGSYHIANIDLAKELNIGLILVPQELEQPTNLPLYASQENINFYSIPANPRVSASNSQATVQYQTISPFIVRLQVITPEETDIIIRDTWYPGWFVYHNGIKKTVELAPPFFRTVHASAGSSILEMRYEPQQLYTGIMISSATAIVLMLVIVRHSILKYKKTSPNH